MTKKNDILASKINKLIAFKSAMCVGFCTPRSNYAKCSKQCIVKTLNIDNAGEMKICDMMKLKPRRKKKKKKNSQRKGDNCGRTFE